MNFTINNRVITGDENLFVVGDNANYVAVFTFDEEWNGVTKTARFIRCDGKYKDEIIKNGECTIPCVVLKCGYCRVGVYSAEMTTTEHKFFVNKSIKNDTGCECEPTPDVYEQLTKHLDDIQAQMPTEIETYFTNHKEEFKGDKGEKGDAGSIKFIIVADLPAADIDETAIYLKPTNDPANQNAYDEYIYTNGNWESIGTANVKFDADGYVKVEDFEKELTEIKTTIPTFTTTELADGSYSLSITTGV